MKIDLERLRSSECITGLPEELAWPMRWSKHHPLQFVLSLTVEKLFDGVTELERQGRMHQNIEPSPLLVPMSLWASTVAYVAARIARERPDSDISIVSTQWCGTPVFEDASGAFWTERSFNETLARHVPQAQP